MLERGEALTAENTTTNGGAALCRDRNNLAANLYLAEGCVAKVYGIDPSMFHLRTRGRARVAEARQVLMYLVHVVLGVSLTDIGRLYNRDRTTAAHACTKMEDRRDDPAFDEVVLSLETAMSTTARLPRLAVRETRP